MTTPRSAQSPDPFRDQSDLEDRVTRLEQALLGSGNMVKIADFVPTASYTALSVANIPQTFKHLRVEFIGNSTRAGFANTGLRFRWSGVSGGYLTNYDGYGAGSTQGQVSSQSLGYIGQMPSGSKVNDDYNSMVVIEFPFYSGPGLKHALAFTSMHDGTTLSESMRTGTTNPTNGTPVTSIDILDDVSSALGPRSKASLYGIL